MKRNNQDLEISRFLKDNLPQERRDEWFVKKTMNRLPPRRQPIFSRVEVLSFIFATILLIAALVWQSLTLSKASVLTIGDLVTFGGILTGFIILLSYIIVPLYKKL